MTDGGENQQRHDAPSEGTGEGLNAPSGGTGGELRSFSTDRPVAILMVFLAAVVFGALSYNRLPITLMPELSYPTITVRTEYPGAAPEEVENDISRPIEEALGVIGGLTRLSSISRAGVSDVVLEFTWDTDMSEAIQDTLEKLDLVFLPQETERPLILRFDPSLDPVLELSLSGRDKRFEGEEGLRAVRRIAELQVKRALEPIKGVAAVRLRGGLEEEIHVLVDEEQLRRTGISIQRVIDRLRQENVNVAGGTLKEGRIEYMVRTLNEFQDLEQIRDTVVARIEGRDVRIRDIAEVQMSHKEREILTRTNGDESVQIDIYKEADANMVALARRVRDALGTFDVAAYEEARATGKPAAPPPKKGLSFGPPQPQGPPGLTETLYKNEGVYLEVEADRSLFIKSSIDEVRNTAILGGLLAVVVLFLFLRQLKPTTIIAVSIPISLLVTFAPLNLLGVTLNIMSLGGLALGIGMLVDSSIVVLESIFRCREEGDSVKDAAVRGTREVRGAVVASTLTSIAVFFPMVFVQGVAGQAFGDLGMAVVISLLVSLIVAVSFIPMLASRGGGEVAEREEKSVRFHSGQMFRADVSAAKAWLLRSPILRFVPFLFYFVYLVMRGLVRFVRELGGMSLRSWRAFRAESRDVWRRRARFLRFVPFRVFLAAQAVARLFLKFRSWRVFLADVSAANVWLLRSPILRFVPFLIFFLYLLARALVSFVFEVIGLILAGGMLVFGGLVARVLWPVLGFVFRGIVYVPVQIVSAILRWIHESYPPVLRRALRHPVMVVLLVVVLFAVTIQVAGRLPNELLPEVHQGELTVEVALPVGTPLEETDEILHPVEQAILEEMKAAGGKGDIKSLLVTIGYDPTNSQRSDEGEHTARFKVLLSRAEAGLEEQVIARLRHRFRELPDLEARITRPVLFSFRTPVEVELHGDDLVELKRQSERIRSTLAAMPELADVETTLRAGAPEVQIVYNRDLLARYDLNISEVAQLVRNSIKGYEATRFNLKDRRVPILVRFAENDRANVEDVADLIVNPGASAGVSAATGLPGGMTASSSAERPIRLSSVADVVLGEGPSEVRRIDGRRVALIRANIAEGSLGVAVKRIEEELAALDLPSGMATYITGQNQEWERSRGSLWLALGLSIFLVYVIMAAQFESLLHPLVIMFTIPLAFFGTILTLDFLNISLSIVVFLGMIMLAGIVVNNAIVLVDYINTLKRRGMSREEAIVTAGSVRLRPILMTTATTVLGLLPMALGLGDGAEIRTPMAISVISGLIASTVLTLLIIPTIYAIIDRWQARLLGQPEEAPVEGEEEDGYATLPGPETATT